MIGLAYPLPGESRRRQLAARAAQLGLRLTGESDGRYLLSDASDSAPGGLVFDSFDAIERALACFTYPRVTRRT